MESSACLLQTRAVILEHVAWKHVPTLKVAYVTQTS